MDELINATGFTPEVGFTKGNVAIVVTWNNGKHPDSYAMLQRKAGSGEWSGVVNGVFERSGDVVLVNADATILYRFYVHIADDSNDEVHIYMNNIE